MTEGTRLVVYSRGDTYRSNSESSNVHRRFKLQHFVSDMRSCVKVGHKMYVTK